MSASKVGAAPGRSAVTIVGASLAGLWAAETLRREGFEGRISMVGDEAHAPYDRPPLSKKYLAGAVGRDRVDLMPREKVEELDVDLRLGCRATRMDAAGHVLEVDGVAESFDGLVVATGTRCRTLPGSLGMAGVHVLRTVDDADAIAAALTNGERTPGARRVVVVGAGFIGAEVASTALEFGSEVAMVEALDEAVEADVHALRVLADWLGDLIPFGDLDTVLEELERSLREELDYEAEAQHTADFAALVKGDARIVVPVVYPALSGATVLTQQRIQGERLIDFLEGCEGRGEGGAADRRQERKNRKQQGLDDFGCVSGPLSLPPPKAKRPGYAG